MGEVVPASDTISIDTETDTKVFYYIDDEDTPYLIKINKPKEDVTLGDFKNALKRPNCKFFFKTVDNDIGVVKEEISDESAKLPIGENGRIVSWLVTAEASTHSGGSGRRAAYTAAAAAFDQSAMTTDSEATLANIHGKRRFLQTDLRQPGAGRSGGGGRRLGDSGLTSDSDATRLFETDDDRSTRVSTSTDITSVSRQFLKQRRRRKRMRPPASRASSITSVTESSMSLNIVTVVLNMDTVNFLGISIVGQTVVGTQRGDGGIFVAHIMKGGAVALDGRIEPGDMILQVNEVSFENLTNDDAVAVLRDAVHRPGPIKLVVAKCWEPAGSKYFSLQRAEPARPIDPGAWVAHTNAMRALPSILEGSEGGGTPTPTPHQGLQPPHAYNRPASGSGTAASHNSGSHGAQSAVDTEQLPMLTTEMDLSLVAKWAARPESGLEQRDRTWLKITIPNAFLGSELVDWLLKHVHGVRDRKEARKIAANMLREGHIRHTVNKITFADQCYYVFADIADAAEEGGAGDHDGQSTATAAWPSENAGWPAPPSTATGYLCMPNVPATTSSECAPPIATPSMHRPMMATFGGSQGGGGGGDMLQSMPVAAWSMQQQHRSQPVPVAIPKAPCPVAKSEASHSTGSSGSGSSGQRRARQQQQIADAAQGLGLPPGPAATARRSGRRWPSRTKRRGQRNGR